MGFGDDYTNPELVTSIVIIKSYHQMGDERGLRCLFEKITGSDNTNKLFHTLIYVLYSGEKIDLGQILWVQFTQSIYSSMKNTDISCVRFWSIVARNARDHLKVPMMADVHMASFIVLNTTTFSSFNAKDFHYIGVIPEVMLKDVLA